VWLWNLLSSQRSCQTFQNNILISTSYFILISSRPGPGPPNSVRNKVIIIIAATLLPPEYTMATVLNRIKCLHLPGTKIRDLRSPLYRYGPSALPRIYYGFPNPPNILLPPEYTTHGNTREDKYFVLLTRIKCNPEPEYTSASTPNILSLPEYTDWEEYYWRTYGPGGVPNLVCFSFSFLF
jgi:hypothetical protein